MTSFTKALLVTTGFFVLCAVILLGHYGLAGHYVDENGRLVEEFWALGLGLFSLFAATVTGLVFAIRVVIETKRQQTSR